MPRFVLLEHVWDGTHWDFMLEDGEILRTWAIDAPVVAGRDLRPVPCRIIGESTWNMKVPISGERGTVRRIDEGSYRVEIWSKGLVRARLQGNQLVGDVELREVGEKSGVGSSWIFRMGNLD